MPDNKEKIKKKAQKLIDNEGNEYLAQLDATLEIGEKIDELKKAIKEIPKPDPIEIPKVDMAETNKLLQDLLAESKKKEEPEEVTYYLSSEDRRKLRGKDGITPKKGVDYFDGEDGYTPVKGKDYFDGKDGSPDDREQIIEKINKGGRLKIKASEISDLPQFTREVIRETASVGFTETPLKAGAGISITKDASGANVISATSTSLALGSADQIPFMNDASTNFEYSSTFLFKDGDLLIGKNSSVGTENLLVYGSDTTGTYARIENTATSGTPTAQLAVITATSGGFFGAFSSAHSNPSWADKAMFGAYSTASGIMISAYNFGQKIEFQIGSTGASAIYGTMLPGQFGWNTNNPRKAVEINSAIGGNLRLSYDDDSGIGSDYVDFETDVSGNLTITPSGGALHLVGSSLRLDANSEINWDNGDATLTHSAGLLTSNVPVASTTFVVGGMNVYDNGSSQMVFQRASDFQDLWEFSYASGDLVQLFGSMTMPVTISYGGSASSPSQTFVGDLDTGVYGLTGNVMGLATAGTSALEFDGSQVGTFSGRIRLPAVSANQIRIGAGSNIIYDSAIIQDNTTTTTVPEAMIEQFNSGITNDNAHFRGFMLGTGNGTTFGDGFVALSALYGNSGSVSNLVLMEFQRIGATQANVRFTNSDLYITTNNRALKMSRTDTGTVAVMNLNSSNDLDISVAYSGATSMNILNTLDSSSGNVKWRLNSGTELMRLTGAGKLGIGTTAPDRALEINDASGNNLRLTYNDSNGSATNYADFLMSSGGDLSITPSGGDINLTAKLELTNTSGSPPSDNSSFTFETTTDEQNSNTTALYIYPTDSSSHRLFLGSSTRTFYALNLDHISYIEGFPNSLISANGNDGGYIVDSGRNAFVIRKDQSSGDIVFEPSSNSATPGWLTAVQQDNYLGTGWYRGFRFKSWAGDSDTKASTASFLYNTNATNSTLPNTIWQNNGSTLLTLGATGNLITTAPVRLKNYTVATLPAGTQGDMAYVTDALAPAFLTAIVGGGAVVTPVFYDGTNWVAI